MIRSRLKNVHFAGNLHSSSEADAQCWLKPACGKNFFLFDSDPQNDASNKNDTRVNNCLATRSGLLSLSIHGLPHLTAPGSADILCALVGFCPQTADEQRAAGKHEIQAELQIHTSCKCTTANQSWPTREIKLAYFSYF